MKSTIGWASSWALIRSIAAMGFLAGFTTLAPWDGAAGLQF
jgi:hypothetical protein